MIERIRKIFWLLPILILVGVVPGFAQEVSIPDPDLNAAVRDALQKPAGPLTEQDLLSLTNLDASHRTVKSIAGLEAARNLVSLDLQINRLTNFSLPTQFTNLMFLNLSSNPLTNCFLPSGMTNLTSLTISACGLTHLTVPADLTKLNSLDLENNQLASLNLSSQLSALNVLDLGFNLFTNFSLPGGLTNLSSFYFAGNPLTNVTLPPGLFGLTDLNVSQSLLTNFTVPTGMTNLEELDLSFNQLTNLTLPADLQHLTDLNLDFNRFTRLNVSSNLPSLSLLQLRGNLFTNFSLSPELTSLTFLDVSESPLENIILPAGMNHLAALRLSKNKLTSFTLPPGLTGLVTIILSENQLTNVVLPSDLYRLETLNLGGNQLAGITLPAGLTNLSGLFLTGNQLTNITLPPDMTQVTNFGFLGNPLLTFVLPETLAATNLAGDVAFLQGQGVSVFTYPLTPLIVRPFQLVGAFKIGITGPPGAYTVLGSTNLVTWSVVGVTTNNLGAINFTDVTAHFSEKKFYRTLLQGSPTNMVFVPPNTFVMGSPASDPDRSIDESPQTTVTLTRGFWIAKFEVTQGEDLSLMNTNPSFFPGDLSRPVSSVNWLDATNYCAKLTQRELAAGNISPGSHFRLPTEAEWECAARAGTATRFSYGDDPTYASLPDHAWFSSNGSLTVHPVGQKLPNPWGLYDMEGNVWEWCQDWFGALPGGTQTDPTGPASNPSGLKVMRGGAYDYPNSSCRSASRLFFAVSPFIADTDLGFRVVLVTEPE